MSELNTEVWVPLVQRRVEDMPERDRPSEWQPGDTVCAPDLPAGTSFRTRRAMPVDCDRSSPTFQRALCAHVPVLVAEASAKDLPAKVAERDVPREDRAMVELHRALKYGGPTTVARHAAVEQILRRESALVSTPEARASLGRLLVQARHQPGGLSTEHAARLARDMGLADDGS